MSARTPEAMAAEIHCDFCDLRDHANMPCQREHAAGLIREAIAEEREACARVIEAMESWDANAGQWGGYNLGVRPSVTVKDAAAAIRARA